MANMQNLNDPGTEASFRDMLMTICVAPKQRKMNRIVFKSQTVEWATAQAVYEVLNQEFAFNFDPCPLGGKEDGRSTLFCSWVGKRVFCNPPYGKDLWSWLVRGREAELAVFLLPARTDTAWFHDLCIAHASEIRFVRRRLTFGDAPNPAPFPSVIVIFRQDKSR